MAGPFALTLRQDNTERIHDLNRRAEAMGLHRGMSFSEARAYCPALSSAPADPEGDRQMLETLRRWATRYSPWVGLEGADGLVLDITGAAHLWGGEPGLAADLGARLRRAGFGARIGLADTRGAAWALARYGAQDGPSGPPIAPPGAGRAAIRDLPVDALRIDPAEVVALQRLGLRTIGALLAAPRATLVRRFGPGLLERLDQAAGLRPEPVTPLADPPHYAARLTLPEPIGLVADVMAGTGRLVEALCARLAAREAGARALRLTLRRVDQASRTVELRLAAALRDPARILPLFARAVEAVDAGFGIDQLRLEATAVDPLPARQAGPPAAGTDPDRLAGLLTRIGTRIGWENIHRFRPVDSHIPERSFRLEPVIGADDPGAAAPRRRAAGGAPCAAGEGPDEEMGRDVSLAEGAIGSDTGAGAGGMGPPAGGGSSGGGGSGGMRLLAGNGGMHLLAGTSRSPDCSDIGGGAAPALRPDSRDDRCPPWLCEASPNGSRIHALRALLVSTGAHAMASEGVPVLDSVPVEASGREAFAIPEASVAGHPSGAALARPLPGSRGDHWPVRRPRPLLIFPPESIVAEGILPPACFRWRRMALTTARAQGPERIAPEWWRPEESWRRGLRDYWRVETDQGPRLWLFHTPQDPGWFVQGEFA